MAFLSMEKKNYVISSLLYLLGFYADVSWINCPLWNNHEFHINKCVTIFLFLYFIYLVFLLFENIYFRHRALCIGRRTKKKIIKVINTQFHRSKGMIRILLFSILCCWLGRIYSSFVFFTDYDFMEVFFFIYFVALGIWINGFLIPL